MRKNARWINGQIRCGKCNVIKPVEDYYKNSSRKDGYAGHCKLCTELYPPRKKTGKGQSKDKRGSQKSRPKKLLSRIERYYNKYAGDAKKRKHNFALSLEEFESVVSRPCKYCGEFSYLSEKMNGVDRIDSTLGYILSNCVPCCSMCNRMKFTYSVDEFISHIHKIASFRKI